METDFDRVMAAGLARLQFEATKEAMIADTDAEVQHDPETNIVKIDFGKRQ